MKSIPSPFSFFFILFISNSCAFYFHESYREFQAPTRDRNVCGHLKDSVVLYAVFVNVADYHPFTEFDINSTMDSIKKACNWMECEAELNNVPLSINPVLHKTKNKWTFDEKKVLAKLEMEKVYSAKNKNENFMNSWADNISKYVHKGLRSKTTSKVETIKQKTTESLIARLRDEYETDNIALMFFVNGYYEDDFSATFNTYTSGPNVEFSLITKKNPAVIAHEFLHLFGAVDLYPTSYHASFNFQEIAENYPDDIMRVQHKEITKLNLSPITKYYIGWQTELCKSDTRLLYHKTNVLEY